MIQLLPSVMVLLIAIGLFCREVKKDNRRYQEQERLGDEHVMREIGRFLKEKGISQGSD